MPSASSLLIRSRAARTMEELKPPARPRSEVATTIRWRWSEPVPTSSFGAPSPETPGRQVGDHRGHALGIGPRVLGGVLARRSFAAATICSAFVIFCVAFTLPIRLRISLRLAIA